MTWQIEYALPHIPSVVQEGKDRLFSPSPTCICVTCTSCNDISFIHGGGSQWRIVHYKIPVAFLRAVICSLQHETELFLWRSYLYSCFRNYPSLRNPKIYNRVQSNLTLVPLVCQINTDKNSCPFLFKYIFNIILLSYQF